MNGESIVNVTSKMRLRLNEDAIVEAVVEYLERKGYRPVRDKDGQIEVEMGTSQGGLEMRLDCDHEALA